MNTEDEILDLVDDNDIVIGTIVRRDYDKLVTEKLGYIREVGMFIQNDEGKLWIPIRTADKKIAPNGLDYSMSGHVGTGETYIEAALRETEEELGLTLRPEDLELIGKFEPKALPYFKTLYIYHSNVSPRYNPEDFVGAEWLSLDEMASKFQAGVPAKTSLIETIEILKTSPNKINP